MTPSAEETIHEEATPRKRLNRIATQWDPVDGLPESTSQSDMAYACWEVLKPPEADLKFMVNETELTLPEAQAWILSKLMDRAGCTLTDEAVAMCLSILTGCEEIDIADLLGATVDEWVTVEEVQDHLAAAKSKYEDAIERMAAYQITDPYQVSDSPRPVILDGETFNRLSERSTAYGDDPDTIVTRLLNETETQLTLEEAVREYLDAAGWENIRAITVPPGHFAVDMLIVKVHTKDLRRDPDFVDDIDAIVIGDQRFAPNFSITPYGPAGDELVRLYTSEDSNGAQGSLREEGFEELGRLANLPADDVLDEVREGRP